MESRKGPVDTQGSEGQKPLEPEPDPDTFVPVGRGIPDPDTFVPVGRGIFSREKLSETHASDIPENKKK